MNQTTHCALSMTRGTDCTVSKCYIMYMCIYQPEGADLGWFPGSLGTTLRPRLKKMCSAPILNLTLVLYCTRIYISVPGALWFSLLSSVLSFLNLLFLRFISLKLHTCFWYCGCTFSFSSHCQTLQHVVVAGRWHSVAVSLSTVSFFLFSVLSKEVRSATMLSMDGTGLLAFFA